MSARANIQEHVLQKMELQSFPSYPLPLTESTEFTMPTVIPVVTILSRGTSQLAHFGYWTKISVQVGQVSSFFFFFKFVIDYHGYLTHLPYLKEKEMG